MNGIDYGERFLQLRDKYRKPDKTKWSFADIERATDHFIRANYLTNLIHGRIQQPGTNRLQAIAQVMGFPYELWFQTNNAEALADLKDLRTLSGKLNQLFDKIPNSRTDEPFTDAEVADLTFGTLSTEQVTAARGGKIDDLVGAQYLALSNVFGVDISYWYTDPDRMPPLEDQWLSAARTEKGRAVLNKFHGRSDKQKDMILSLLEEFAEADTGEDH